MVLLVYELKEALLMERHIGLWKKENEERSAVAELVIDGNRIEFYSKAQQGMTIYR